MNYSHIGRRNWWWMFHGEIAAPCKWFWHWGHRHFSSQFHWHGRRWAGDDWLDPVPVSGYEYPVGKWYSQTAWGRKYLREQYPEDSDLMREYFKPIARWTDALQNDFAFRGCPGAGNHPCDLWGKGWWNSSTDTLPKDHYNRRAMNMWFLTLPFPFFLMQ